MIKEILSDTLNIIFKRGRNLQNILEQKNIEFVHERGKGTMQWQQPYTDVETETIKEAVILNYAMLSGHSQQNLQKRTALSDEIVHRLSHASGISILSDKHQFPSFLRTVASVAQQPKGLAQLLMHYHWEWVGLLATGNDYGLEGSQQLKEELMKSGFCVAFYEMIPLQLTTSKITSLVNTIKGSSATVIVLYAFQEQVIPLMEEIIQQNISGKIWIATASWVFSAAFTVKTIWKALHGTIGLAAVSNNIPGFKDFLYMIHPDKFPNDILMTTFWETVFHCKWTDNKTAHSVNVGIIDNLRYCTGQEKLHTLEQSIYPVSDFRFPYNMYNAIYAVAHALQTLLGCRYEEGVIFNTTCADVHTFKPQQVLYHLRKVRFKDVDGEDLFFDGNGDVIFQSNIINWQLTANSSMKVVTVGQYKPYSQLGLHFYVNNNAVLWSGGQTEIPNSVCSEACHPGYRKLVRQGQPACCFDCIPCSDGEISNASGNCIKCPEDYWSNAEKDFCIAKYIEFLSYEDPLGTSLGAIAVVLSLMPVGVLCIFIKHHDTPVVKANNREVSYFLLISNLFCLLTALIFIGPPMNETCVFRQPAFGILFSICVSAVLAKTITVVIAFNATKPGSRMKNLVGSKISFFIIFSCFVFQFIICIVWISVSPPFSETDKKLPEKSVIQCNEGSVFMFYSMLGYLGILATISLIIAFLARNLPDSFNETRFITFSMVVFVSVWLTFIPAYISTKGKYMVAAEIFAILSSSTGLLFCIFLPKCYIVLLRPDMNTRGYIMRQQNCVIEI
ncbi:extracellular calcium-sensing receptor-like [Protopterus annectens]|uniref:extracellular calcium-sensing receptor-like n=1 Tax=Protopterus annectens TaxID=7888 RepID=UPI001CFA04B5|nr:extracellular calcium-sensing receptor-like [Protopterus annectens]